jgi:hypothetical protein
MKRRIMIGLLSLFVAAVLAGAGWYGYMTQQRIEAVETRVTQLDHDAGELRAQLAGDHTSDDIRTVAAAVTEIDAKLDDLEESLFGYYGASTLSPSIGDLDTRLSSLERDVRSVCMTLLIQANIVGAC